MKHLVTLTLIVGNILVFVVFALKQQTLTFSTPEDFLTLFWSGANFNPFTLDTEPWRLITSMFMHWNFFHLLVNMYGLYNIGRYIESEDGSLRLIWIYLLTGLFAGIASLMFGLFKVSAGASGAIFGLYGYHIISQVLLHWKNRDTLINIMINFAIFAVINYLIATQVQVDTAGHLGGLISGALLALLQLFDNKLAPATMGVVLMSAAVMFMALPKDQVRYYNMFQTILQLEDAHRDLFKQKLTDQQFTDSLKLYLKKWDGAHQTLRSLPHIPEDLQHDTTVLNGYLTVRKNELSYRIKMYEKESYIYMDSIEHNMQLYNTLGKLKYSLNYRIAALDEPVPDSIQGKSLAPIRVFYDSNWVETDDIYDATYYRIGHRDSLNRWQGDVRDYFRDGTVQMKGTYKDDLHHGIFLYYSKDSQYESAGRYEKDLPAGKWEYYYFNGKLHREVVYANRVYTRNVYDTTGALLVNNGYGNQTTWFGNGNIQEEGRIENGWRQGVWRGYHEDGTPYYEEFYNDNMLVRGQAIDKKGNRYLYDQSSLFAAPEIGYAAYRKYLLNNVKKPGALSTTGGRVKLHFVVDANGELRDFVVVESLCVPCDKEAIRLVQNGPKWRPALLHGHVHVRSQTYAEVDFE